MRIFRLSLWPALPAVAIAVEWSSYDGGGLGLATADAVVAVAFFVGALLVWGWARLDLIGLLFLATGLAWLLGTLSPSLLYLHRAPFVLLLLAYPTRRLRTRLAWIVAAFVVVDAIVIPIAQDDALTLALVGIVFAAAASGPRSSPQRRARALATACAALVGAGLALGSISRLAGSAALSDTSVLLAYELTLVVAAIALAVGVVVERSQPAAITDLVVELGAGTRSEALRDALAVALGDATLQLGYRAGEGYVDAEGKQVLLPEATVGRALTVIEQAGEPIAALVHDAAAVYDPRLDEAVAAALRLAASNALLQAELRTRVAELAASQQRMIAAEGNQRRRLERRLRAAAEVHLEEMRLAIDEAASRAPAKVATELEPVRQELEQAVSDLLSLARGIHPLTLTERGLEPALAELVATAPTPVSIEPLDERFSPSVEATAYFVCAEALANVAKYARAAHASVELQRRNGQLRVAVTDDGVGGADPTRGSGLRGLADRVQAAGGRLTVTSPQLGGTHVVAEIPLEPV